MARMLLRTETVLSPSPESPVRTYTLRTARALRNPVMRGLWIGILLLLFPAMVAQGAPPMQASAVHVVQWGENLTVIAARYGVSVNAIVQANHLTNPNRIYVGQRLVIPQGPTSPTVTAQGAARHTVQPGDTLSALAVRYGCTVDAIVQANQLVNPSYIYVGQVLAIPAAGAGTPAAGTYYTVRAGDTLAKIAYRYGVSYWAIAQANNLSTPWLIYVGQVLFIPGGVEPPPASDRVEGLFGLIVGNLPGAQYDDYLEDVSGNRFGIDATDPDIRQLLAEVRNTDHIVCVWGTLRRNVPDVNGVQILVSQIEMIWEPSEPMLAPLPATATPAAGTQGAAAAPTLSSTPVVYPTCAPPQATTVPLGAVPLPTPWAPKALRMNSPEYGMEVYLWKVGDCITDRDLRLVKEAGFTWVKQLFPWREIEVRKGEFNWAEADRIVAMVAKYQLDLAIAVAYQPEWAGGGYPLNGPPNNMADFAEFMAALAGRYKGIVRAYEIWPGPNVSENWGGQSPDYRRYAEMLIDGYWYAKKQDPYAMIISGGLVQTAKHDGTSVPPLEFLKALYRTDAAKACDVWGVQALGYLAAPENTPAEVANPALNNNYPATAEQNHTWCFRSLEDLHEYTLAPERPIRKQWVVTRMSWTTDPRERSFYHWAAVSEEVKADYVQRAYRWARENWSDWVGVMFVPLTSARWTTEDSDYWWGIVLPDGSPRPAYRALKEMAK